MTRGGPGPGMGQEGTTGTPVLLGGSGRAVRGEVVSTRGWLTIQEDGPWSPGHTPQTGYRPPSPTTPGNPWDFPPLCPEAREGHGVSTSTIAVPEDGVGPLTHRRKSGATSFLTGCRTSRPISLGRQGQPGTGRWKGRKRDTPDPTLVSGEGILRRCPTRDPPVSARTPTGT